MSEETAQERQTAAAVNDEKAQVPAKAEGEATSAPQPPLEAEEGPRGIPRVKRWAIRLVILVLVASVFYLLAERNRRFYFLSTEGEHLVVSRGTWLPSWKAPYQPEDPLMVEAYAPIEVPPGEHVPQRRFDERQDLDQVLFEVLIGWAQERILADEPESLGSGTSYLERAALLPGISGEQFTRIRALRAEVAFSEGRSQLVEALSILDSVSERLALAASGTTPRARRAQAILQKITPATEALTEALEQMRAEPGSKASDLSSPSHRQRVESAGEEAAEDEVVPATSRHRAPRERPQRQAPAAKEETPDEVQALDDLAREEGAPE